MWTYEQHSGHLIDPNGLHVATGYSGGNCGKHPEGMNNPAMENVPDVGPIPCGTYKLGPVLMQSHLGPFAIPLIPDPANEMFGRSGFYMHGDNSECNDSASDGCIIMAHDVRLEVDGSGDKTLQVVA